MASIDDASSRVYARFYAYEGTLPAMDSFQRYVTQYGISLAVYADRPSPYKASAEPTIEEQLAGRHSQSPCGRALGALGVELIHAHSPQAKGRVERLFHTFQDRVVKELLLAGVATLEAANQFLEDYLPRYNQRFTVSPAQATDLHRPSPASRALDRMRCLKTKRVLRRDWTVAHNGQLYQVQTNIRATHVLVEERVDGTMRITHQDRTLASHVIASRPVRAEAPPKSAEARRPVKPTVEHPWRKRLLPDRTRHAAAGIT